MQAQIAHPDNGADALVTAVQVLERAFIAREWMLLAGLLLTVVVVILRGSGLTERLPGPLVPWATLGLATATSVALGLQSGESVFSIIVTGIAVGLAAIGGWESFGKLVRGTARYLKRRKKQPAASREEP